MNIQLRYPSLSDLEELKKACLHPWSLEWGFVHYFDSLLGRDCEKLIDFLPPLARGVGIDQGHVPCTFLFAFSETKEILGRVSIRHFLTPQLETFGGHIGYGVIPEHRNKGVASEILKKSLEIARSDLGLKEVLLTCDDTNQGSIRTIEKNNGVLIDRVTQPDTGVVSRRYKIIFSS